MGNSPRVGMFLAAVSRLPLVARVVILHMLHLSKQSEYLDLRTELTVAVLRSFVNDSQPRSISSTQKLLGRDPGVKGRIWVSRYASPVPPEADACDALLAAVEGLMEHCPSRSAAEEMTTTATTTTAVRRPELVAVEAEWTGYRAGATRDSLPPPQLSERELYGEMMRECTEPATILYLHGGAHCYMDPATHRPTTKKLAKLTGGRCYSVRYRLAPQNPFPAALLDALVSYLTLLYPPPGAFHDSVKPEHVVFCGDSAGGNLALALLQTILQLGRQKRTIKWFGEERTVPTPAGCGVNSPWIDMTVSSPSWSRNTAWDYLPSSGGMGEPKQRPACAAWPASPPRRSMYVDDGLLLHPLATLLTAPGWEGAPPVFLCTGWELLADEDRMMAARLDAAGVRVVFEEYEAMPHCFALLFPHLPEARRCFGSWAGFVRQVTSPAAAAAVESSFVAVKARSLKTVPIQRERLRLWSDDEVRERLVQRCRQLLLLPQLQGMEKKEEAMAVPKL